MINNLPGDLNSDEINRLTSSNTVQETIDETERRIRFIHIEGKNKETGGYDANLDGFRVTLPENIQALGIVKQWVDFTKADIKAIQDKVDEFNARKNNKLA